MLSSRVARHQPSSTVKQVGVTELDILPVRPKARYAGVGGHELEPVAELRREAAVKLQAGHAREDIGREQGTLEHYLV